MASFTVTKGLIGKEDLSLGTSTFSRTTSTGATQSITQINPGTFGIKAQRITTGSIGGGARANVTVTWISAFADTSYTVSATVLDSTTGATVQGLVIERMNSILAGSVSFTIFNPTGGALTGTLHVVAVHD